MAESLNIKKEWLREVKKVVRKVTDKWYIKFDEHGVLAFYSQANKLRHDAGFKGLYFEILLKFCPIFMDFLKLFYTHQMKQLEKPMTWKHAYSLALILFLFLALFQ